MPHLMLQEASVYNGYFRGPVTLTSVAERLAVELSLLFLTTQVCRGSVSNNHPSACEANALTDCATSAVICIVHVLLLIFDGLICVIILFLEYLFQ